MSSASAFRVLLIGPKSLTPIREDILQLSGVGFLVQISETTHWQTGDRLQAQLDLPRGAGSYDEPVKLVKAYTKWGQDPVTEEKIKLQILEMHFLSLATQKKSVIDQVAAAYKLSGNKPS